MVPMHRHVPLNAAPTADPEAFDGVSAVPAIVAPNAVAAVALASA
jgi:hypothetical protein